MAKVVKPFMIIYIKQQS